MANKKDIAKAGAFGLTALAWISTPENREKAQSLLRHLPTMDPTQRVLARIDIALLAFEDAQQNGDPESERTLASKKASEDLRALRTRLLLPYSSVKARRDNRHLISEEVDNLLARTSQLL